MAKYPERSLSNAPAIFLYESTESMPWSSIEAATRTQFDEVARREIFGCTISYSAGLSFAQAAKTQDVEALRARLLSVAQEALEIYSRYAPYGADPTEEDLTTFLALPQTGKVCLSEAVRELGSAAGKLVSGIRIEQAEARKEGLSSQRKPQIEALENFIRAVLQEVDELPARSGQTGSVERKRWAIPVGPNSKRFEVFVNAVLDASFTRDQVRDAVRRVVAENNEPLGRK